MFCYIINFIKFRHREIPQFLRTILHIYSRIVIREPPLPRIVLEDLRVEAISPSSGGADEFLELSALRQVLQRLLRRHGPGLRFGVRDQRGIAACALCPWTRTGKRQPTPSEAQPRLGVLGGWSWKGLKNLEEGSMDEQNEKICIEFLNRSTQVCTIFGASRTRLFLGVGESPKSLKGRCHWFRCHFLRSGSVNRCISGRFSAVLLLYLRPG